MDFVRWIVMVFFSYELNLTGNSSRLKYRITALVCQLSRSAHCCHRRSPEQVVDTEFIMCSSGFISIMGRNIIYVLKAVLNTEQASLLDSHQHRPLFKEQQNSHKREFCCFLYHSMLHADRTLPGNSRWDHPPTSCGLIDRSFLQTSMSASSSGSVFNSALQARILYIFYLFLSVF